MLKKISELNPFPDGYGSSTSVLFVCLFIYFFHYAILRRTFLDRPGAFLVIVYTDIDFLSSVLVNVFIGNNRNITGIHTLKQIHVTSRIVYCQ